MTWIERASEIIARIAKTQQEPIDEAARVCSDAIGSEGLVHCFGTGHSRIPVEELFPRYGSYPGFNPVLELSLTNYTNVSGANGLRQAMFLERVDGLAEVILNNYVWGSADAGMIFSVSGRNAVPVQFAQGLHNRGLPTIAVTSLAQRAATDSDRRTHLADVCDVVIDLCIPTAEAVCDIDGSTGPVGPTSTLAYITIVNEIKVRTAELLARRNALPPVITHSSLIGAAAAEASVLAACDEHSRRTGRLHVH